MATCMGRSHLYLTATLRVLPNLQVPYRQKIWQELNLADRLESARAKILADLNLAVRYGIAIRIYACKKYWRTLIWRL